MDTRFRPVEQVAPTFFFQVRRVREAFWLSTEISIGKFALIQETSPGGDQLFPLLNKILPVLVALDVLHAVPPVGTIPQRLSTASMGLWIAYQRLTGTVTGIAFLRKVAGGFTVFLVSGNRGAATELRDCGELIEKRVFVLAQRLQGGVQGGLLYIAVYTTVRLPLYVVHRRHFCNSTSKYRAPLNRKKFDKRESLRYDRSI
jgi:hypothetical protein